MMPSVLAVLVCAGTVMAGHQDVVITGAEGRLATQARVYGADLGEVVPNFGDEPGFDAMTLPALTAVGFDLLDAARVWDGSDFDALSAGVFTLELAPGVPGTPSVVSPAASSVVPGFVIATADGDGGFHQHIGMTLGTPADAGVYLLSLRLWDEGGVLGNSEPIWFVLNNGLSEKEHEAAMVYVEEVIVPSPGVGMIGLAAVVGGWRRRR